MRLPPSLIALPGLRNGLRALPREVIAASALVIALGREAQSPRSRAGRDAGRRQGSPVRPHRSRPWRSGHAAATLRLDEPMELSMSGSRRVAIRGENRLLNDFFKIDEVIVAHQRFDGSMSGDERRLVFE